LDGNSAENSSSRTAVIGMHQRRRGSSASDITNTPAALLLLLLTAASSTDSECKGVVSLTWICSNVDGRLRAHWISSFFPMRIHSAIKTIVYSTK